MSSLDTSPRNSVAATVAAVQSYPPFSATFSRILSQRKDDRAYIPYYVYKDESQSFDLGGIPITVRFDPAGSDYYPTINDAFKDITLATGVSFKEVAGKSNSLLDIGRLEDGYSKTQYYRGGNYLGLSQALSNRLGHVWRLQTWRETESDNATANLLDTRATIRHEIGHAIGLSHPDPGLGEDGFNPSFNQLDTVMSYNMTIPPNPSYTLADQIALKSLFSGIQGDPGIDPGIALKKDGIEIFEYSDDLQKLVTSRQEADSGLPGSSDKKWYPVDPVSGLPLRPVSKGSDGSDFLLSGGRADLVLAGGEDDWISSGAGDDIIDGGGGTNRIQTGSGRDTVVIRYREDQEGFDAVHDFSSVDRVILIGFQSEGLAITSFGQRSVLTFNEDILGVFDHPLSFAQHVKVMA